MEYILNSQEDFTGAQTFIENLEDCTETLVEQIPAAQYVLDIISPEDLAIITLLVIAKVSTGILSKDFFIPPRPPIPYDFYDDYE